MKTIRNHDPNEDCFRLPLLIYPNLLNSRFFQTALYSRPSEKTCLQAGRPYLPPRAQSLPIACVFLDGRLFSNHDAHSFQPSGDTVPKGKPVSLFCKGNTMGTSNLMYNHRLDVINGTSFGTFDLEAYNKEMDEAERFKVDDYDAIGDRRRIDGFQLLSTTDWRWKSSSVAGTTTATISINPSGFPPITAITASWTSKIAV